MLNCGYTCTQTHKTSHTHRQWNGQGLFAGRGDIWFMTSIYFSSEEGGEDPRIGDFGDTCGKGETWWLNSQKTGCDSCYWDICYWLWLLGDNRASTLTGEGGFAKLRCAYRSTAMSFWLASSAMERAELPSCKRATEVTNQNKHFHKS